MSDNVFADMEMPNPQERMLKAEIVLHLRGIVADMKLTQAEIATQTGMTQPEVSNMLRGICKDISVERLLRVANLLHHNVRIVIDATTTHSATTTVELAGVG